MLAVATEHTVLQSSHCAEVVPGRAHVLPARLVS